MSLACSKCLAEKDESEFYFAVRNVQRAQRGSWCKTCTTSDNKQKRRDWTPEQREYHAKKNRSRSRLKKLAKYGLTIASYGALFEAQGGVCAICERPERVIQPHRVGTEEPLSVDHDHATGKVRGLLCFLCNTGIGKLGDDPDLLRRAADYIERGRR